MMAAPCAGGNWEGFWRLEETGLGNRLPRVPAAPPRLIKRKISQDISNPLKSTSSELWIDLKMWDLEISKQRFISRHSHLLCVSVSSVKQSCLILWDPMDWSMPGLPVHRQLPGFTQTHVHWVSDAIQPSHPLSSPSLPAFNLSQHQGLFQWVSTSHQVAKILEFKLLHQSLQWIFRTDFL